MSVAQALPELKAKLGQQTKNQDCPAFDDNAVADSILICCKNWSSERVLLCFATALAMWPLQQITSNVPSKILGQTVQSQRFAASEICYNLTLVHAYGDVLNLVGRTGLLLHADRCVRACQAGTHWLRKWTPAI